MFTPTPADLRVRAQSHVMCLREAQLLSACQHPNVTKVFGVIVSSDGRPGIVMERVATNMLDEMKRCRDAGHAGISPPLLWRVSTQLVQVCAYLHSLGVCFLLS